ncbi:hypothetical protein R1flu_017921 [Riccia fluitans]|uniref:Uncharacterized protein n=1 Tax=Riccia fluitans TaxID=41844 RepID=A0ABD1ZEC5_9MARC
MLRSVCCKSRSWERCHLQLHFHSANQSHRRTPPRIPQSAASCSQRINKLANMASSLKKRRVDFRQISSRRLNSPQSSSKRRVNSLQTEDVGFQITSCLTQVHPRSPSHATQIDIFFFHGLQLEGNSVPHLSSWRSGDASQELWPQTWLRTEYPDARIILLSYDASAKVTNTEGRMSLYAIAEALLVDILIARNGIGRNHAAILHQDFNDILKTSSWKICGFGEAHPTEGASLLLVLDASSRFGDEYCVLDCDHFSICRPENPKSSSYLQLVKLIDSVYEEWKSRKRRRVKHSLEAVGVDSLLSTIVEKYLRDYQFLALWGMGGVGKTTIARLVFEELTDGFEYACFVGDFKLISGNTDELKGRIWDKMLHYGRPVPKPDGGHLSHFWSKVAGKKLLLVLDGIDQNSHVKLLGSIAREDNFSDESRFITTSRNHELLRSLNVYGKTHICGIPYLHKRDAKELFVRYAFPGREEPKDNLKDRIDEIVEGCGGLPLTLEILGTYLQSTRDEKIWDQVPVALRNAESIGDWEEKLWAKLRISFDALQEEEKNMFLDVACIFSRDNSSFTYKQFQVHEHLRSIGDKIAKDLGRIYYNQISEGQGRQNHEIVPHDLQKVISYHAVIKSDSHGRGKPVHLECNWSHPCSLCNMQKVLSKMTAVRYLNIRTGDALCRRCLMKGGIGIPTGTAMVRYHGDARLLRFKPGARGLGKLAVLDLWLGGECFFPLLTPETCEYLSQALKLLSVGYLYGVEGKGIRRHLGIAWERLKCLQELNLDNRSNFTWEELVPPRWLSCCIVLEKDSSVKLPYEFASSSLNHVRVSQCDYLLGTMGKLSALRRLELVDYSDDKLPETFTVLGTLERLVIDISSLQELPDTFGRLSQIVHLELSHMFYMKHLPWTFGELSRLEHLVIIYCGELESLPETFGNLIRLRSLTIVKCPKLLTLPSSFGKLMQLEDIEISHCPSLSFCSVFFDQDELSSLKLMEVSSCLEALGRKFAPLSSMPRVNISPCTDRTC